MNTRNLVDTAAGRRDADLMIQNALLVNVFTKEIEKVDVSVTDGRIARVALCKDRGSHSAKEIVDAEGLYMIPGLIDAHAHVEMSFLSATHYAEAVLPQGTTAGIFDTHDIGNVSNECMLWFGKEMAATPLKGFITANPCIPSTPQLEHAGLNMDLSQLKQTTKVEGFVGIGEAMDFNRVIGADKDMMDMLDWAREQRFHIDGHCPEIVGDDLQAYAAAGPCTDHEFVGLEEALEKYRLGFNVVVRRGSLAEPVTAKQLTDRIKDTRNLLMATDGCIYLDTLINKGSMMEALRMVVAEGVDPITAVQMATINVARAYALDHQIGAIAPGLCADMVLIKDLEKFPVAAVWVDGKKIPPADEFVLPNFAFPESVLDTIALKPVSADIFAIKAPADSGTVKVHALDVKEDILISGDLVTDMTVTDGLVHADTANDILKIGVLHRYAPESWHTTGFVRGFGFKKGALAGSIGQDSQNIAVIGVSDEDMAAAVNAVIDMKGGVVMVADGKVLASVELRLGGIMNHTKRPKELLADFEKLNDASRACGGAFTNPAFPLSLMITCACIPDLKITDCALVDAISGQEIPLFA